MKRSAIAPFIALTAILSTLSPTNVLAAAKQNQAPREPDLCVVPPGAQPLLPAKLLPGMGKTKDFPVTTKSEEARKFFLQGVSQIHSFWFMESERSCAQAAQLDPDMAMAHWCIALSAAGDYRPAFQYCASEFRRRPGRNRRGAWSPDAVARTTNGAGGRLSAREAIAKAMALRGKWPSATGRHQAQAARRRREEADAA
jgi:hypothetical protein